MSSPSTTTPGCGKFSLPVDWQDCSWVPSIGRPQGGGTTSVEPTKPLPGDAILAHPVCSEISARPIMNKPGNRKPQIGNAPAFTLIELLVVITIIGILAAMLAVALPAASKKAKVVKAKTEIADIVNAIQAYDADYSRYPISPIEQADVGTNDYTCGLVFPPGPVPAYNGNVYNNSNVVAILMDLQTFPNGANTCNFNHVKNPKQVKYLNAKMSGYDPNTNDPNPPGGVDNSGIYRDPWGNPYVITMNTSYSMDTGGQGTSDVLYCRQAVSQLPDNPVGTNPSHQAGYNGLFNPNSANPNTDNFLYHGKVMVWSAGPDKTYDPTVPANSGKNKDNILSWQ
jgi:prepilin-type N-terminal cleavage/methylation domain-containing protein